MLRTGGSKANRPCRKGAVVLSDARGANLRVGLPQVVGPQEVVIEKISRQRLVLETSDDKRSLQPRWRASEHERD
jgi:hypothetical protein